MILLLMILFQLVLQMFLIFCYSWIANCAWTPKVPGSSLAASYMQRWALGSNHPANVYMSVKLVEVVERTLRNSLSLSQLSCESWVFVKENLDKKKCYSNKCFSFFVSEGNNFWNNFFQFFFVFHKLYPLQFVYFKISFILVLIELLILKYFYTLRK